MGPEKEKDYEDEKFDDFNEELEEEPIYDVKKLNNMVY